MKYFLCILLILLTLLLMFSCENSFAFTLSAKEANAKSQSNSTSLEKRRCNSTIKRLEKSIVTSIKNGKFLLEDHEAPVCAEILKKHFELLGYKVELYLSETLISWF
jgi:uncharacterized protein YpmS